MSSSMPFLRYLDLDDDADERAIRRAYALRLKAIDQEADPEGFQALREAYVGAMNWAQWRQRTAAEATQAQHETPAPVPRTEPSPHEAPVPPTAMPRDSRAMAEEVRAELALAFRNRLFTTQEMVRAGLEASLDDPRLVDMDARYFFEWGVASLLAAGWQPGHELLFDVAIEEFHWRHERARLFALGREGQIIDGAIVEIEAFNSPQAPIYNGASRQDLIKWLRADERPANEILVQCTPVVEQMAAMYPNWLHIVTNTQNIRQWRAWVQEIAAQAAVAQRKAAVLRAAKLRKNRRANTAWAVLFVVSLCVLLWWSVPEDKPAAVARRGADIPVAGVPSVAAPQPLAAPQALAVDVAATKMPGTSASYLRPPVVSYPPLARLQGQQGKVIVDVLVRGSGEVADVRVLSGSGYALLDEAAVRGAKSALYLPAKDAQGRSIDSWVKGPIDFKLSDASPATNNRAVYAELIRATIRPNIIFVDEVPGNPVAEVDVQLAADGTVQGKTLSKPSGVPAWDAAVLKAIDRTQRFPPDFTGKAPPVLTISFRPKG